MKWIGLSEKNWGLEFQWNILARHSHFHFLVIRVVETKKNAYWNSEFNFIERTLEMKRVVTRNESWTVSLTSAQFPFIHRACNRNYPWASKKKRAWKMWRGRPQLNSHYASRTQLAVLFSMKSGPSLVDQTEVRDRANRREPNHCLDFLHFPWSLPCQRMLKSHLVKTLVLRPKTVDRI